MSRIKINTASLQELTTLSSIGPVRAQQIIDYRTTIGAIDSVSKLMNITGISLEQGDALSDQIDWQVSPIIYDPFNTPMAFTYKIDLSETGIDSFDGHKLQIFYSLNSGFYFPVSTYLSFSQPSTISQQSITIVDIPETGIVEGIKIEYQPIINFFRIVLYAPNNSKLFSRSTNDISDYKVDDYNPPVKVDSNFTIKIENYDKTQHQKFKLEIIRKVKVQANETIQKTIVVAIGVDGVHEFIPPPNEEIRQLKFRLIAPNGATVDDSDFLDWDAEAQTVNEKAEYNFAIPEPEQINSTIIIEEKSIDELPWANHRFVVSYELFDSMTRELVGVVEKELPISFDGKVIIGFDYYGLIKEFNLKLIAPSGEKLHTEIVELEELEAEYSIPVPERKIVDTTQYEILPERPAKTVGRVIDSSGKSSLSGIQVIIYATQDELHNEEDNEKQTKYDPILVVLTETDGYFVLDTPQSHYTAAYALIGQISETQIPVRLEEDTIIIRERVLNDNGEEIFQESTVARLFLPDKLILVVDSKDEEHSEECDCNECKTLDFHKPHRVLEEFSYYSVVRTSEPQIQGFTLEEDGTMTLSDLKALVPNLNISDSELNQTIRKSVLQKYINSKHGLTSENFRKAIRENQAQNLKESITPQNNQTIALGRYMLDTDHVIDWDETPTIYQATSLAFGHLLQYKQEWVNDGYSLGEPLYSLPLAPGQKKQIVVFDWERRESAERSEELGYRESLYNSLGRNRDVHEIVDGVLTEKSRAGSRAKTSSASAGFGLGFLGSGFGALLGASGGKSSSSSSAWQSSARRSSMNDLQTLRDKTIQSANATRSQRATVVQSASQGERFSAETETVANYNHCHAITIVYFEILRHFKIEHRLASVQECLFVPLIMTAFDNSKILRWREILGQYLLRDRFSRRIRRRNLQTYSQLSRGFDAIERIENDYEGSDLPGKRFADDAISHFEGDIFIKFQIGNPADLSAADSIEAVANALKPIRRYIGDPYNFARIIHEAESNKRYEIFQRYVAPQIATNFVEDLEIFAKTSNDNLVSLKADLTLISNYHNNRSLRVSVRYSGQFNIRRADIKALVFKLSQNSQLPSGQSLRSVLPDNSQILLTSASIQYRTDHYSDYLVRESRINNDIIGYGGQDDELVYLEAPLNRNEERNPRNEDLELAASLKDHLNDNLEYYHKAIWLNMTPERRYMFLDGIQAKDYSEEEYPNGVIRSVASVVENRVIGVAGNSLIMPVAPGYRLDPSLRGVKEDLNLLSLYKPLTPLEPTKVSVPTKGVFAEAIMGQCNSCEKIDETRFWRWGEEPIPDNPTAILPIDPGSRRADLGDLTPSNFETPMIVQQNAPAAPNPQGFGALSQLLGTSSFENLTGLDANQRNAIEALKASYQTTQAFGSQAAKLAALSKVIDSKMPKEQKDKLINDLSKSITGEEPLPDITNSLDHIKQVNEMASRGDINSEQASRLSDGIIENISKASKSLVDNQEIKNAISRASNDPLSNISIKENGIEAMIQRGKHDDVTLVSSSSDRGLGDLDHETKEGEIIYEYQETIGEIILADFDIDSSELKPYHKQALDQLIINIEDGIIKITSMKGRASRTGGDDHNLNLSRDRLNSVADYLYQNLRQSLNFTMIAAGESEPFDMQGPLENKVDRSVQIFFEIFGQIPKINEPVKVSYSDQSRSKKWKIRMKISDKAKGLKGQALIVPYEIELENLKTNEVIKARLSLVGMGAGIQFISPTKNWSDWIEFETVTPVANDEWHGTVTRLSRLEADVYVVQLDKIFLYFYGKMDTFSSVPIVIRDVFNAPGTDGAFGFRAEGALHGTLYLDKFAI